MSLISFSGIASGIDTQALIKAITDRSRKTRIEPLEDRRTSLQGTNSSLEKLSGLLDKLKSSGDKFREINGTALSKNVTSTDESVITASASNSAVNTSTSVNVSQIAKTGSLSFNDRFATTNTALKEDFSGTGVLTVSIGSGANQENLNLSIDNTTTLEDLASQINEASGKGTASIVNVGSSSSPSYALAISSKSQGTLDGTISITGDDVLNAEGLFTSSTLSQATDAQFSISGISGSITRSSNSVSDVITGLTLNLNKTGTSNITVSDDQEGTTQTVQDFVDSFNEVAKYIRDEDQITRDDGEDGAIIFGSLSSTSLDESILQSIRSTFSKSSISGGLVNVLSDLGITTQRDGTLAFDTKKFKESLSQDPESVRTITKNLGEQLSSVDGTIAQFNRFNGLIDITSQGNSNAITRLNEKISGIEFSIAKQTELLTAQFARLESLIGGLQSQQSKLSALF